MLTMCSMCRSTRWVVYLDFLSWSLGLYGVHKKANKRTASSLRLPFFRMYFTSPVPLTLYDEPLRCRSRDSSEGFLAGRLTVKSCQRRWALSASATPENWRFSPFGSESCLCRWICPLAGSMSRTVVVWRRSPFPLGMAWLGGGRLDFSVGAGMCLGEPELALPSKGWRSSSDITVARQCLALSLRTTRLISVWENAFGREDQSCDQEELRLCDCHTHTHTHTCTVTHDLEEHKAKADLWRPNDTRGSSDHDTIPGLVLCLVGCSARLLTTCGFEAEPRRLIQRMKAQRYRWLSSAAGKDVQSKQSGRALFGECLLDTTIDL